MPLHGHSCSNLHPNCMVLKCKHVLLGSPDCHCSVARTKWLHVYNPTPENVSNIVIILRKPKCNNILLEPCLMIYLCGKQTPKVRELKVCKWIKPPVYASSIHTFKSNSMLWDKTRQAFMENWSSRCLRSSPKVYIDLATSTTFQLSLHIGWIKTFSSTLLLSLSQPLSLTYYHDFETMT